LVWVVPGPIVVFWVVGQADAAVGEQGEGRVEDRVLDAVGVHLQAGEEGLVESSSGGFALSDVQPVAVLQ